MGVIQQALLIVVGIVVTTGLTITTGLITYLLLRKK